MDYPFNFTAVIDLLCIVPIIFKFSLLREWLADLLYGQLFTGLYCLRIIRTKRLVTVGGSCGIHWNTSFRLFKTW